MLRFPRLMLMKYVLNACSSVSAPSGVRNGPLPRAGSPVSGCSTLMTSAPRSAISIVENGPAEDAGEVYDAYAVERARHGATPRAEGSEPRDSTRRVQGTWGGGGRRICAAPQSPRRCQPVQIVGARLAPSPRPEAPSRAHACAACRHSVAALARRVRICPHAHRHSHGDAHSHSHVYRCPHSDAHTLSDSDARPNTHGHPHRYSDSPTSDPHPCSRTDGYTHATTDSHA